ncbi:isoleucine--tRNA ligase [Coprothermobacteraceae bacterium]|nr:isoleucine--tRNA ligase [Coprothermobacteraceae bacterium]
MADEKGKYDQTLNLPQPLLNMKANLPLTEQSWLKFWEDNKVFERALEKRAGKPLFILHDGPPYANGDIHVGTALNKVLKDTVNKFKLLMGFRTPFVPGWDTHGLPIEQQVTKQTKVSPEDMAVSEWRNKCRDFAKSYIDKQMHSFKRLGVFGLWDKHYATFQPDYEARELEVLAEMVEKGVVVRKKRSVYWCPHCKTTLAEAEIEYKEKTSPSIFVAFPAKEGGYEAVIWTTTPWTLPDNVAVAFNPEEYYVMANVGSRTFVVAEKRLEYVSSVLGWSNFEVKGRMLGTEFDGVLFEHPIYDDKVSRGVLAEFVSMDDGTGVVHIAPGHGEEDFELGVRLGLDVAMMVDDAGKFTEEAGFLNGVFYADANLMVLEFLEEHGKLLAKGSVTHSYPHCWRCHNPVIFRALDQWFVDVDAFRHEALEAIDRVKWVPEGSDSRIRDMVQTRPDWCLSRQRIWGVPIPSLRCKHCQQSVLDSRVIRNVARETRKEGSNVWYERPLHEFLPPNLSCPHCGSTEFEKEFDILDVWFDSGVSHFCVLEQYEGQKWPADLYLEGYDQHRGWFQTSLLTSVALKGEAPYDTVLSHGFVLDEQGRAMSKSLGNVVDPLEVIANTGADVLRLALVMTDYTADVQMGKKLLGQASEVYRKIRNTFRFMEGNLYDFRVNDALFYEYMRPLDRWILHQWDRMKLRLTQAFQRYEFFSFVGLFHSFCVKELSSIYLDSIKARLYLKKPNSKARRSAQTALFLMAQEFPVLIAPILTFTAEEMWQTLAQRNLVTEESVYFASWPTRIAEMSPRELEFWDMALEIKESANEKLEDLRKSKVIGHSLDARAVVYGYGVDALSPSEWAELLGVSAVHLDPVGTKFGVEVEKANGSKCQRCWRVREDVGLDFEYPDLCSECIEDITG